MTIIKVIKNEKDYEEALSALELLIDADPDPNSDDGEKMSILATLIKDYETRLFPVNLPDPISAIKFKMDQKDLKPSDLIPFIGSRSRVSEILSGKRGLTIEMIRSLEAGLGIPAEVLIKKSESNEESIFTSWSKGLISEMNKRGYFSKKISKNNQTEVLSSFFSDIGLVPQIQMLFRQSNYRSSPATDKQALISWAAQVIKKAKKEKLQKKYKAGTVDLKFMQKVARLSAEEAGPIKAQKFLKDNGILLIIEPHFAKTRLDGAMITCIKDIPVIGLTLRHDRLDNFWFTLMHELAHISLHYTQDESFFDELETVKGLSIDDKEKEADDLASEALVPKNKWDLSPAKVIPSSLAASSLAKELGVHIVIVAGKIRYEGGKWIYLNDLIGKEKVQHYFN